MLTCALQRIMELEGRNTAYMSVYVNEAGSRLNKDRHHGGNTTDHRTTVDVPVYHGGNITMYTAIPEDGVMV